MIRLILRLFGIRDFEPCQSCENLKEQLRYERETNFRLTDTIVRIVSPKVTEAAPQEIAPIAQSSMLFSRRRAALEEKDRQEAFIIAQKKHLAQPDSSKDIPRNPDGSVTYGLERYNEIEKLEKELGVEES